MKFVEVNPSWWSLVQTWADANPVIFPGVVVLVAIIAAAVFAEVSSRF